MACSSVTGLRGFNHQASHKRPDHCGHLLEPSRGHSRVDAVDFEDDHLAHDIRDIDAPVEESLTGPPPRNDIERAGNNQGESATIPAVVSENGQQHVEHEMQDPLAVRVGQELRSDRQSPPEGVGADGSQIEAPYGGQFEDEGHVAEAIGGERLDYLASGKWRTPASP
jgi:hypothetical protein